MQIAEVEFLGYIGGSAPDFRNLIRTDIESQASNNVTDSTTATLAYTPRYLAVPR